MWGFKSSQFNSYFTEICTRSEEGSYFRLVDFVYHSTLGLRVVKKREEVGMTGACAHPPLRPGQAIGQDEPALGWALEPLEPLVLYRAMSLRIGSDTE